MFFPIAWFSSELQLNNKKLIFFNKENINTKRNLWLQKRQYILEFMLHVLIYPELIFVQIHGYILFKMNVSFAALNLIVNI